MLLFGLIQSNAALYAAKSSAAPALVTSSSCAGTPTLIPTPTPTALPALQSSSACSSNLPSSTALPVLTSTKPGNVTPTPLPVLSSTPYVTPLLTSVLPNLVDPQECDNDQEQPNYQAYQDNPALLVTDTNAALVTPIGTPVSSVSNLPIAHDGPHRLVETAAPAAQTTADFQSLIMNNAKSTATTVFMFWGLLALLV